MTYDAYRIVFYAGIVLAVIFLLLAFLLFFVLNIPAVIGDLTGSTQRKAIESIRNRNANDPESGSFELGKSQKLGGDSNKLGRKHSHTGSMGIAVNTAKFNTQTLANEARESYETTVLAQANETTVLSDAPLAGETTVLSENGNYGETSVLTESAAYGQTATAGFGETTELGQGSFTSAGANNGFAIEYEITLTHTEEVIA